MGFFWVHFTGGGLTTAPLLLGPGWAACSPVSLLIRVTLRPSPTLGNQNLPSGRVREVSSTPGKHHPGEVPSLGVEGRQGSFRAGRWRGGGGWPPHLESARTFPAPFPAGLAAFPREPLPHSFLQPTHSPPTHTQPLAASASPQGTKTSTV